MALYVWISSILNVRQNHQMDIFFCFFFIWWCCSPTIIFLTWLVIFCIFLYPNIWQCAHIFLFVFFFILHFQLVIGILNSLFVCDCDYDLRLRAYVCVLNCKWTLYIYIYITTKMVANELASFLSRFWIYYWVQRYVGHVCGFDVCICSVYTHTIPELTIGGQNKMK